MITIKRIFTYEELDSILPLIDKLHDKAGEYAGLFTKTGYYAWLLASFGNPNLFGIWVGYNEEVPVGYIMVGQQYTCGKREALVYEAYCTTIEDSVTIRAWAEVVAWAKLNGCTLMSCYTERGSAISRKFGFQCKREYLTKEI